MGTKANCPAKAKSSQWPSQAKSSQVKHPGLGSFPNSDCRIGTGIFWWSWNLADYWLELWWGGRGRQLLGRLERGNRACLSLRKGAIIPGSRCDLRHTAQKFEERLTLDPKPYKPYSLYIAYYSPYKYVPICVKWSPASSGASMLICLCSPCRAPWQPSCHRFWTPAPLGLRIHKRKQQMTI